MEIKAYCKMCGKPYIKRNGKSMFCSDACKKARVKQRYEAEKEKRREYQKKWQEAHGAEARARFKENHPNYERDRWRDIRGSQEYTKQCCICGKTFATWNPNKTTCSADCERKKANERRNRKRIPDNQIVDKDITLEKLFNRDSGVCYLCGGKCDWSDRDVINNCTGNNYPTIDHVMPISRGGMHAWDNIKLAHMACNASKRDKLISRDAV